MPRRLSLAFATFLLFSLLGCEPGVLRPGLWLSGEDVTTPVTDWSFTAPHQDIYLETSTWYGIPHSVTIWGVEHGGEFYIGSYDETKTWEGHVARNPDATLRIDGKLYEITTELIEDPALNSAVFETYEQKYDMEATFGDEVPEWWFYRVASRG